MQPMFIDEDILPVVLHKATVPNPLKGHSLQAPVLQQATTAAFMPPELTTLMLEPASSNPFLPSII